MELSAVDPWGASAATVGSAGPSPPPMVSAPGVSGPWGTASTDPWGVASPTSPNSTDPWGGGAPPPSVAPPPDPWGETNNTVNNVDPWGSSGKRALQPVGCLGTRWSPHMWKEPDAACGPAPHPPGPFSVTDHITCLPPCSPITPCTLTCFRFVMTKASMLKVLMCSPCPNRSCFHPLIFTQDPVATTALA